MIAGSFLFDCSAQVTYHWQADRRWQIHIPPVPTQVQAAMLGLGSVGQFLAEVYSPALGTV
jgi:hypothetical protein